jgi:hypothetical protein
MRLGPSPAYYIKQTKLSLLRVLADEYAKTKERKEKQI